MNAWANHVPPRRSFWRSPGGLITAIAITAAIAIAITALVGVAAFLYQLKGSHDTAGAGTVTPAASGTATQPASPTRGASAGSSLAAGSGGDAGSGPYPLVFGALDGIELDAIPPYVTSVSKMSVDMFEVHGLILSTELSHLAIWSSKSSSPSRTDCVNLLNRSAISNARYTKGSRFCVRTNNGTHVAFVEFIDQRAAGGWFIQVTVWPGSV